MDDCLKYQIDPAISTVDYGITSVMQRLQNALLYSVGPPVTGLPWIERVYGLAKRKTDKDGKTFPIVENGQGGYTQMQFDDRFVGTCFFYQKDPETASDNFTGSRESSTLSLIVFADLRKIDSSRKYHFEEQLIAEVKSIIINAGASLSITNTYKEIDNVLNEFSGSARDIQNMLYPRTAFRIDMNVSYPVYCGPVTDITPLTC